MAKFRAARRMWAKITKDLGATDTQAQMLRFHTQTAGSTLTAQQPYNNIMRVTIQALAAVMGGTQSLHTNGFDEALALPTEEAARIALRTQQVIGYESGVPQTVDPLAGSYFIESLTNEVETAAWEYLNKIERWAGQLKQLRKIIFKMKLRHQLSNTRTILKRAKDNSGSKQICRWKKACPITFSG